MILPALTLWQPWACAIECGFKTRETRAFPPPPRMVGKRIAIHAAARKQQARDMDAATSHAFDEAFDHCGWFHSLPLGVIVCTAVLASAARVEDVEPDPFGDYTRGAGRWAWMLDDIRPIEPHIPAKGRQMIGWPWEVPENVARALAAETEAGEGA